MRVLPGILIFTFVMVCYSFVASPGELDSEPKSVKCMVQLINYEGEGAYIVASVVDQAGIYQTTLRVLGDDEEWYPDLPGWWGHYAPQKYPIDGITGATISGGERSIFGIQIEEKWIGQGYKIRFETSVEDQDYHEADLEFDLTQENLNTKLEGTGYIRYVRLVTTD